MVPWSVIGQDQRSIVLGTVENGGCELFVVVDVEAVQQSYGDIPWRRLGFLLPDCNESTLVHINFAPTLMRWNQLDLLLPYSFHGQLQNLRPLNVLPTIGTSETRLCLQLQVFQALVMYA